MTDNFRLVDDGGHEWGYDGFKDEQEFIEYMKDIWDSSTEFEVVREKSKWKCVELNKTFGFTEGKIYEVGEDGMIYYDSGIESSEKLSINGNEAKCWRAKFEKVEEDGKVKLKVGDRVVVNGEINRQLFNNAKGKVVTIGPIDYGVEFDDGKDFMHDLRGEGKSKHCFYVYKNMVTLDNTIKKEEEKVVNKFKVGDIIKGKANNKRYGYTNKDMTKGEVTKVYNCDDIEVKVLEHSKYNREIGSKYDVESDYFELVTPHKKSIHLTFDGNTTHAVVKEDGKVVKREKVGLYSGDVYDEATGVREVIDKLYGKKVVEDVKPKFVKAKVGDTIKIVNAVKNHCPDVKNGDTFKITEVDKIYVGNGENSFGDDREEYIIIPAKSLSVGDRVKLLDGKGRSFMGGWTFSMGEEVGKIATIKEVREDGKSVLLNEVGYVWDIDCLELVKHSQISEYTTDELLSEIKKRMEE